MLVRFTEKCLLGFCGLLAACAGAPSPVTPAPVVASPPAVASASASAVASPAPPPSAKLPEDPVDPRRLERLTISVPEPHALAETRFQAARETFRDVTQRLAEGSYVERKDPRCQQALVSDQRGAVRGFTQFGGTEHHYAEVRHYFDQAGALRLLLYKRNDEAGGNSEDIVAFAPAGDLVACKHIEHHPGMAASDLCTDEKPEPKLDPEVKRALKPSAAHRPRNKAREDLQSIDPAAEFERCSHSGR